MAKSEISYSGVLERALLVQNVRSLQSHLQMSDGQLVDKLTIHFQRKKSSRGGDVEEVVFPLNSFKDDAIVIFEDAKDMQSAAEYEQVFLTHQLKVGSLPPVFTSVEAKIDPFYRNIMPLVARGEPFKRTRNLPVTVEVNKTDYGKISCSHPSQLKLVEDEVYRLLMSQGEGIMMSEEGAVEAANVSYSVSEYSRPHRNLREHGKRVCGKMDFAEENFERGTIRSFSKQSDELEEFFDTHSPEMEVTSASANGEHDGKSKTSQEFLSPQNDGTLGETDVDNVSRFKTSDNSVVLDNYTYDFCQKFKSSSLREIMKKNKVQIKVAKVDDGNLEGLIVPSSNGTPAGSISKAKDEFIDLYQKVHFSISRKTIDCSSVGDKATIEKATKETMHKFKADTLIVKVDGSPHLRLILRRGDVEEVVRLFRTKAGIKSGKTLRTAGTDVRSPQATSTDKNSLKDTQFGKDNTTEVWSPDSKQKFQSTTHSSQSGTGSLSRQNMNFTSNEGLNIVIRTGDITEQSGDAVVSPSDSELTNDVGGVAKAILTAAGHEMKNYCHDIMKSRHYMALQMAECVVTPGFNLKYKAVIHVCGPTTFGHQLGLDLNVTFLNCLRTAEVHKMSSLALPLIGSGLIGAPKKQCADSLAQALINFSREYSGPKFVKEVSLVNLDSESCTAIQQSLHWAFNVQTQAAVGSSVAMVGIGISQPTFAHLSKPGEAVKIQSKPIGSQHSTGGSNYDEDWPKLEKSQRQGRRDQKSSIEESHPKEAYGNRGASQDTVPAKKLTEDSEAADRPSETTPHGSANDKNVECVICLGDKIIDEVQLQCKHRFCKGCIEKALKISYKCPVCQAVCRQPRGNQPDGTMKVSFHQFLHLPGYNDVGTITINYEIPNGIQSADHPNPSKQFQGLYRAAYLPDNQEGREVLQLLQKAFDARLVFTVGRSITSGRDNVVTWNDIHHKTSMSGGPQNYGYPDPDYLKRVKEDLAAKGIV